MKDEIIQAALISGGMLITTCGWLALLAILKLASSS